MGVTLDGHSGKPIDARGDELPREPGKLPKEIASRTFRDTDGDGQFDRESIGGAWWIKDE